MRKFSVFCFILLFPAVLFAQKNITDPEISDIDLLWINSENPSDYDIMDRIDGKIVLLEFWEHWCGPCITSMPHLQKLQDKFPDAVRIIAVSGDDLKKSRSFIDSKDYGFDFIFDKDKTLHKLFPHNGIPHTVLFDAEGRFVYTSHPELIDENTIEKIINGEYNPSAIDIGSGSMNENDEEEQNHNLISIQLKKSQVEGYSGKSRYSNPPYRFDLKNYNILEIISTIYSHSKFRILYPEELSYIDSHDPDHLYDLLYSCVEEGPGKISLLKKFVCDAFDLAIRNEEQEKDVWVIKGVKEGESIKISSSDQSYKRSSRTNSNSFYFNASRLTLQDIGGFIEEQVGFPVVAEKNENRYDVDLQINHEGQGIDKIYDLLLKAGFSIEKEKRKIKVLVIDLRTPSEN